MPRRSWSRAPLRLSKNKTRGLQKGALVWRRNGFSTPMQQAKSMVSVSPCASLQQVNAQRCLVGGRWCAMYGGDRKFKFGLEFESARCCVGLGVVVWLALQSSLKTCWFVYPCLCVFSRLSGKCIISVSVYNW